MNTPKEKRTKPSKAASTPAPVPKSKLLQVEFPPGISEDRMHTELAAAGLGANANIVIGFSAGFQGELSLTDMVASLKASGEAVNGNDFSGAEKMLNAQAIALNAIFSEMARRAALNMGTYLGATESYMRLALKAQSQCRTTLETLAAIKNPPVVFARQANINNGGQQQVNNGGQPTVSAEHSAHAHADACGEKTIQPNKLLAGIENGSEVLDSRATGASTRGNSAVEAVGTVIRP